MVVLLSIFCLAFVFFLVFFLLESILVWLGSGLAIVVFPPSRLYLQENDKRLLFALSLTVLKGADHL